MAWTSRNTGITYNDDQYWLLARDEPAEFQRMLNSQAAGRVVQQGGQFNALDERERNLARELADAGRISSPTPLPGTEPATVPARYGPGGSPGFQYHTTALGGLLGQNVGGSPMARNRQLDIVEGPNTGPTGPTEDLVTQEQLFDRTVLEGLGAQVLQGLGFDLAGFRGGRAFSNLRNQWLPNIMAQLGVQLAGQGSVTRQEIMSRIRDMITSGQFRNPVLAPQGAEGAPTGFAGARAWRDYINSLYAQRAAGTLIGGTQDANLLALLRSQPDFGASLLQSQFTNYNPFAAAGARPLLSQLPIFQGFMEQQTTGPEIDFFRWLTQQGLL